MMSIDLHEAKLRKNSSHLSSRATSHPATHSYATIYNNVITLLSSNRVKGEGLGYRQL